MLEAGELQVRRGAATLLEAVSLALAPGELLGIIGPNGAGKTTLLRTLAGLEPPDSGKVALDGISLAALGPRKRARLISFLPQDGRAEWAVTVRELVALGRLPYGTRPRAADQAAIVRAIAAAEIEAFADRPVTTLSGGERARALFARALAVEAPYLLIDEPILALDPRHQLSLMERLRALAAAGTAVAVVLHDLALAARFCSRLALLERGKLAADGPAAVTLASALLERVYGIRALAGEHEGAPWLLPWQVLGTPRHN